MPSWAAVSTSSVIRPRPSSRLNSECTWRCVKSFGAIVIGRPMVPAGWFPRAVASGRGEELADGGAGIGDFGTVGEEHPIGQQVDHPLERCPRALGIGREGRWPEHEGAVLAPDEVADDERRRGFVKQAEVT